MIDRFGVPKHIAHFIIALERGETEGDVIIVPDPDKALDSGDVVPGEDGKE
jgi:K+/H+ antiporter YhaU regulatory subunit KhtT